MSTFESLHAAENRALDRTLRAALRKSGAALPAQLKERGPLQILDLACGTCREADTLVRLFRDLRDGEGHSHSRGGKAPVRFVGADIRDRELDEAARRARAAGTPDATFEFLTENCARIDRHSQLGKDFDITFLRHQNYWNDAPVWRRIFDQGLEKLKDDGLLVITSYFDREHELAVQALESAGAELIITEANAASRAVEGTPGKSVDRHVAVFRKKR